MRAVKNNKKNTENGISIKIHRVNKKNADNNMIWIKNAFVEQFDLKLYAEVIVSGATGKRKLFLLTSDEHGIKREVGEFSVQDVIKGKAVNELGEVIPALLDKDNNERDNMQGLLKEILQQELTQIRGMNFKEIHEAVIEFVKKNEVQDY